MGDIKLEGFLYETLKYLEKYLRKKDIVEICINREKEVMTEDKEGNWKTYKDNKLTKDHLERLIKSIGNKTQQKFSENYPIVMTHIPEFGFRITGSYGNAVANNGVAISIRIGNAQRFPLEGYFGEETAKKVKEIMVKGENMLISGGTSTGKTTCLNSLIPFIPEGLRILSLENMVELSIDRQNHVPHLMSESRLEESGGYEMMLNLFMKSRPDRILIGELTPQLTKIYLRMANSGHSGTMTTIHADSAEQALDAFYVNLMLAGATESKFLMHQVKTVIKYVIQCKRTGSRKIEAEIFETDLEDETFIARKIA